MIENDIKLLEHCVLDLQHRVQALEKKIKQTQRRIIVLECKADRKTENSSEKPNNCEHITEDGVTCAKYPACDDCLGNPLNKVKGSERLVKSSEQSMDCLNRIAGEIKQADTPQTMEGTTTANHFYGREGESK